MLAEVPGVLRVLESAAGQDARLITEAIRGLDG
jgi:hypothetical protein